MNLAEFPEGRAPPDVVRTVRLGLLCIAREEPSREQDKQRRALMAATCRPIGGSAGVLPKPQQSTPEGTPWPENFQRDSPGRCPGWGRFVVRPCTALTECRSTADEQDPDHPVVMRHEGVDVDDMTARVANGPGDRDAVAAPG